MPDQHVLLDSEDDTTKLAQRLAPLLSPGDVILLEGGLGAGKTHFARAVIQARLPIPEDVPSPTFTLVQCYNADDVEIWHADLYRLTDLDEVLELGLDDALETAICLIEWPERMGADRPVDALTLTLVQNGDARLATLSYHDPRWAKTIEAICDDR